MTRRTPGHGLFFAGETKANLPELMTWRLHFYSLFGNRSIPLLVWNHELGKLPGVWISS